MNHDFENILNYLSDEEKNEMKLNRLVQLFNLIKE